jgi:hypothetical protein
MLQIRYGPGGIRTHVTEIKVRPDELQQAAVGGNVVHFARIETAANCNKKQCLETSLYAHSYARFASG